MAKRRGWVVRLVSVPRTNDFRDGYFPRKFAHKRDAVCLLQEVEAKGGRAVVEPDEGHGEFPEGYRLRRFMGEYCVVDAEGVPFRCDPSKEKALQNARRGLRPDGPVRLW